MQLLQITSHPIQYEYEVEHARLEYQQEFIPQADVQTQRAEIKLQSKNIQVQLDTYEARKSLGIERVGDRIRARAEQGKQYIQKKTREYVEMGQQMSNIAEGVTIHQIISEKMVGKQKDMYTMFLPRGGAAISWVPNELKSDYQEGELSYDWKETRNMMNYVPGSVRMNILEYPKVEIKYMGRPMYFPTSADPEYVEPAVG